MSSVSSTRFRAGRRPPNALWQPKMLGNTDLTAAHFAGFRVRQRRAWLTFFCVSDSTNSQPQGALGPFALPHPRSSGTFWGNRKNTTFPAAYRCSMGDFACYLCNTSLKTAGTAPFQGGPLLRDYDCWAMVIEATEGGIPRSSRLGVSLKSLAFMRECPKARGDRAVSGDQGNLPCGVTYTTGLEPSLESKTWRFYEHH